MLCEKSQFNSAVGSDGLSSGEISELENHLAECVSCRQKSIRFAALRRELKSLPRPVISADQINRVKTAVASRIKPAPPKKPAYFSPEIYEWLQMRVMPYAVGVSVALITGVSLIWFLMVNNLRNLEFARLDAASNSTFILNNENFPDADDNSRLVISGANPSINPTGALLAMTKSIVSGQSADDKEVVVVADVFSNGLARIAEVVEPKSDERKMRELDQALQSDPDFAPFLPARIDRRAETVRVIFKIQRVDVIEPAAKKKK